MRWMRLNMKNQLVMHHEKLAREHTQKEMMHLKTPLPRRLNKTVQLIKERFYADKNADFQTRFTSYGRRRAYLIYLQGTVEQALVEHAILAPLNHPLPRRRRIHPGIDARLSSLNIKPLKTIETVSDHLLNGYPVLVIDGERTAYAFSMSAFPSRQIGKPDNENVLKGPHEAFTEDIEKNSALIRRYVRTPKLIHEMHTLGRQQKTSISLFYIEGVINPALVDNIKKRLDAIDRLDYDQIANIEQFIEERPYSLLPSMLTTERPDRVAAHLLEGHIAIMQDNFPYAYIAPATYWTLFHTPEDHYARLPYAWFSRGVRTIAFFLTLLTPAAYVAVTNYHLEMIPIDLLMAIAGTREMVPFPVILEILLMEFSFELIREASIRIPSQIGPTIGIVGAIILGQAAVQANIVSPIMVIVVAITGLASYAHPDLSFGFAIRIARFFFIAAAATLGFLGIALLLAAALAYAVSFKSFGVGYFTPWAPYVPSSHDVFLRKPLPNETVMPLSNMPVQKTKANRKQYLALDKSDPWRKRRRWHP
ncbi:MAG: spore germination protein [Candidatus Carbobacillus altaicus]|nr:spore germination protein [Candidatus Carbobacillus altaicus]